MTESEALAVFRSSLAALAGVADDVVLLAYQTTARPRIGHLTIKDATESEVGRPQRVNATTERHRRQLTVEVEARGQDAVAALRLAKGRWRGDNQYTRAIGAAGVAPQGMTAASNRSAFLQTGVEPRLLVAFRMGYEYLDDGAAQGPLATSIALGFETTDPDAHEADPVATFPIA